jgi:hypothetical protein
MADPICVEDFERIDDARRGLMFPGVYLKPDAKSGSGVTQDPERLDRLATRLAGQTQTMIPPQWWWWLADRRRCDVKRAPTLRHADPGLLPTLENLGADFPSFRPTIGEPDTPAWQELRAAPVAEALILGP